ncbi:DeoR family transcriptional regulator [Lentzea atacamensis]|uniref:DeoR family transcriptional regulator n=1 Tax=Lentzea atacamensis TaxID=531938 RepID=A0A316HMN5_9PSEU|nr:DeoR/GlpR family DNA-binding transcription regulator [Lentzea atacamensis]PWK82491.1 DeoR family transcriptional regulator [Lentzea atacamensis]
MLAQSRRELILRTLRTDGPSEVRSLADKLGVSQATIRRDLEQLDADGKLTRVYGGAMTLDDDDPFAQVATQRAEDKDAVARTAAAMVQDGETVLLDIGTTMQRLAHHLHGKRITVITSNLAVFDDLRDDADVELILLGGMVRRRYHSLAGFLTEDNLRQVHAGRLFLGTSGVRGDGAVMDTTLVEVPLKRAMIKAADQVVLVADGGKFPGVGVARVCGPDELDAVVTTASADPATRITLQEAGVDVVQV